MAVPKRRQTHGRSQRRFHSKRGNAWKSILPSTAVCKSCGMLKLPHRACRSCGAYKES